MKQIVKNFNNLIKKTIFKVENKTNDKFHVSKFSKYLISAIVVLFIYIFYLSIPLLYDKNWIQNKIVTELGNEFNINLGNSFDFSYRILPKPHYLIRDSKTSLAEIKTLNVLISQNNFFNKDSIRINEVVIEEANFSLLKDNLKTLYENSENKFSKKKIRINNSNIFFKNNLDEVISIIKISNAFLFFDEKNLFNLFDLKGEIFKMSKRAVILAGGLGTRLKPYTHALPKPLMPIGQYPILEIVIRQLSDAGFDRITLAVNHQADIIKAYFQDGSKWNVSIDYSLETERLGTMGPLDLIHDLPDNFLVMNGDVLTAIPFEKLFLGS